MLEETGSQRLDKFSEVVADATSDLSDGLIGSAGDAEVLLDGSSKGGLNHTKGELTGLLALGKVGLDKVLHNRGEDMLRCNSFTKLASRAFHLPSSRR